MSQDKRTKVIKIVPGEMRSIQLKFFRLIVFSVVASTFLAALGFYGVITLVLRTSQLGPYAEMQLKQVFYWMNALFVLVILLNVIIAGLLSFSLSHRIAGPIYRIQFFLQEIINTGKAKEIKIREKDEFESLVSLLNVFVKKFLPH